MKRILFLIAICASLLSAYAQSPRTLEMRAKIRDAGYSIYEEKTYNLKKGATASYTRTFYSSTQYAIVAISEDTDVSDIDIMLYETSGDLYKQDTEADATPIVDFAPSVTRSMKVVVKNYNTSTPNYASPVRLIIAGK